ncbi:hypothetical protein [Ekhidna sp.]|jgi:hypothetical protein|uniref:hypothetical protein n=1 Tax=Ekhidna sp. TaxID=2608089 RepID=UPI0032F05CDA
MLLWLFALCSVSKSLSQTKYEYYYEPVDIENNPSQYIEFINGKGYLMSINSNSKVAIYLERTTKKQIIAEVAIVYSGNRFDFFPSKSISITGLDKNYDKVAYRTYSFDEYLSEVERKNRNELLWSSISEAFKNYGAGNSSSIVYDNQGKKIATVDTYDPDKARASKDISEEKLEQIESEQESTKAVVQHSILKPTTLYKGDILYGTVYLEIPKEDKHSNAIHVEIEINDESHNILFRSAN